MTTALVTAVLAHEGSHGQGSVGPGVVALLVAALLVLLVSLHGTRRTASRPPSPRSGTWTASSR